MTDIAEKATDNVELSVERQVMRGSRDIEPERPGAKWQPEAGEIYVQSNYYEIGVADEYGSHHKIIGIEHTRRIASLATEALFKDGELVEGASPTDILPPRTDTEFYRQMDEHARQALHRARQRASEQTEA